MLVVCPRSQKSFLPLSSAHTKLVKRGIVRAALKNSVLRSCHHRMFQSLQAQAERLLIAGYPRTLLLTVAESVLKSTTSKEAPQTQETRRGRINVIPYVHKVSHGLKKIAQKARIITVFSAPNKLGRMCKAVNDTTPPKADCSTNHATRFVPCRTNVVYEIPLECDAVYVGQTGRCINERLREHAYALCVGNGSHLVSHCKACGCIPFLDRTKVLKRYTESRTREIFEAYSIAKKGRKKVSVRLQSQFLKKR